VREGEGEIEKENEGESERKRGREKITGQLSRERNGGTRETCSTNPDPHDINISY
jgi:hypothetical protein